MDADALVMRILMRMEPGSEVEFGSVSVHRRMGLGGYSVAGGPG